jgi:uncharacterized protein (TIRG00374 family)
VRTFWRRLIIVIAIGVAVIAGFSIYADVGKLGTALRSLSPLAVLAALSLACANYVIRFVRWELYLRAVDVHVPRRTSALVFVSGFVMSITPGKVGELWKAMLLREIAQVPAARTAPVVIAERLTDLLALVVLGIIGAATYRQAIPLVVAASAVTIGGVVVLSIKPLARGAIDLVGRIPRVGRVAPKLHEMHEHLAALIRPVPLLWATLIGLVAWLCECVGFWLIIQGFPTAELPIGLATFIYAATTVAGALSFLPGGLGVTEASMTAMLFKLVGKSTAVAATIVTRLCTLWFAVAIGLVALLFLRRAAPTATARATARAAEMR